MPEPHHRSVNDGAGLRRIQASMAGHQGDSVKARHFLSDNDPAVRAAAIRALDRVRSLTVDDLTAAINDCDTTVRVAALEIAAQYPQIPLSVIVSRLDDPDARVVEVAAWTCGELAGWTLPDEASSELDKQAAPDVPPSAPEMPPSELDVQLAVKALAHTATTHHDALCRESAVAALGAIGDSEGLDAILSATNDKLAIRLRAVISLAPFDSPEAQAALQRALNDRARQVREAATEIIHATPIETIQTEVARTGPRGSYGNHPRHTD